jgi:hypothetical protein
MHDLAERIEVGVLSFELVNTPFDGEIFADLNEAFLGSLSVSKLVLHESGKIIESGMRIQSIDGEILILPSSFPCNLAVRGAFSEPHIFKPEYPLDRYQVIPFTSS